MSKTKKDILPPKKSEAVRVVVRVRPFNKRETALQSKSCIDMDLNNGVCIYKNLQDPTLDKPFKFDSVFEQKYV